MWCRGIVGSISFRIERTIQEPAAWRFRHFCYISMMFRVLLPNIPKGWSILPQKARHNNLLLNGVGSWVGLRGQALYSYFWFEENGPKIFLEATEKWGQLSREKAVVFPLPFPGLEDGYSWASSTWQAKSITTKICSQKPIETWNSSKIPKKNGVPNEWVNFIISYSSLFSIIKWDFGRKQTINISSYDSYQLDL